MSDQHEDFVHRTAVEAAVSATASVPRKLVQLKPGETPDTSISDPGVPGMRLETDAELAERAAAEVANQVVKEVEAHGEELCANPPKPVEVATFEPTPPYRIPDDLTQALAEPMSAAEKKEVLHRRQIFDGKRDGAEEVYRRDTWRKYRCTKCNGRPVVLSIKAWAETAEVIRRSPQFFAQRMALAQICGQPPPLITFKFDDSLVDFFFVSEVYACQHCKVDLEKEAAKAPSWYVTEIQRGPGKDVILSMVPRGYLGGPAKANA